MYLKEDGKNGRVSQLLSTFLQEWSNHQSCLAGDGKLEREHKEGDVELHLPRPLRRHVLHPGGQH